MTRPLWITRILRRRRSVNRRRWRSSNLLLTRAMDMSMTTREMNYAYGLGETLYGNQYAFETGGEAHDDSDDYKDPPPNKEILFSKCTLLGSRCQARGHYKRKCSPSHRPVYKKLRSAKCSKKSSKTCMLCMQHAWWNGYARMQYMHAVRIKPIEYTMSSTCTYPISRLIRRQHNLADTLQQDWNLR